MNKKKVMMISSFLMTLIILAFGIPFYLGYGNPLPFMNDEYSIIDNMWLIVIPLVFIFTLIGLKWRKISGIILIVITTIAQIITLMFEHEVIWVMMIPILLGILYILIYLEQQKKLT